MAFNPLRSFRRHQKTLLAGLTIVCMFVFVLSFSIGGGGDFFDRVTNWIGYSAIEGHAGQLYGKVVTDNEVARLKARRQLANEFMQIVNGQARATLQQTQIKLMTGLMPSVPQLSTMFQNPSMQNPMVRVQHLSFLRRQLEAEKKEKEAKELGQLIDAEIRMMRLPSMPQNPDVLYFGGSLKSPDDLFNFMIWLHEADRLGIVVEGDNIGKLIIADAQGVLGVDNITQLQQFVLGRGRVVQPGMLAQALSDEFRVRLARTAYLGYDMRRFLDVAPGLTPFELWQFFEKKRTSNQIAVTAIPVDQAAFLAKAGEAPEDELLKLFDKYKDKEPLPGGLEPSFKQPSRIEVQWIHADPKSDYYQKEARKVAGEIDVFGRHWLSVGLSPGFSGLGNVISKAAAVAAPLKTEMLARSKYSWMIVDRPIWYRKPTFINESSNAHPASVRRGAADLVAATAASSSSFGSILTAASAYQGTIHSANRGAGLPIYTRMFLAGAAGTPVLAAAEVKLAGHEREFLEYEDLREQAAEKVAEDIAEDLADSNLTKVREGVLFYGNESADLLRQKLDAARPQVSMGLLGLTLGDALTGAPGLQPFVTARVMERSETMDSRVKMLGAMFAAPSPLTVATILQERQQLPHVRAQAFLKEAAKKYHVELRGTQMPRDKYEFLEDVGVKPLREQHQGDDDSFLARFFPEMFRGNLDAYSPEALANRYYFWKSAEEPAYVPTYLEARKRVVKAWQLDKAKKFAKEEADKLAEAARKIGTGDAYRVLKDGTAHSKKLFFLYDVAPLVKSVRLQPGARQRAYQLYRLPEADVKYPSRKLREKLLEMKKPGEVIVEADQPEQIYYVAALVERRKATEKEFFEDYANNAQDMVLFREQDAHARKDYLVAVVKRLEQEAGLVINEEYRKSFLKGD